jgi:hypothetical protein
MFKDGIMRKPDKPSLFRDLLKGFTNAPLPSDVCYVVDGGYLLHKVRWLSSMDVCDILPLFTNFLNKLGSVVHVVFDGYSSEPSIKDHEHLRCASGVTHIAQDRQINNGTKQVGPQDAFLANVSNKTSLIKLLMEHFERSGIHVYQAVNDADVLIVSVALKCLTFYENAPVAVLAEDTDILTLLLHHVKPKSNDVFFVSPPRKGRGGKTNNGKIVNIHSLQQKIGIGACERLLVVHALGGCDSTSAIFGLGKGTIYNKIASDEALHTHCMTLQSRTSTVDQITTAGSALFVALYGGKVGDKLSDMRYAAYCTLSLSRCFKSEKLPPSDSAVNMHVKRVHYQALVWENLSDCGIKPTDWGWQLERNKLVPIQINGEVAPAHMLSVVRCKCKGNCSSSMCSCRKHGLKCVSACGKCHGSECTNIQQVINDSDLHNTDDNKHLTNNDRNNVGMPDFLWEHDIDIQIDNEEEV